MGSSGGDSLSILWLQLSHITVCVGFFNNNCIVSYALPVHTLFKTHLFYIFCPSHSKPSSWMFEPGPEKFWNWAIQLFQFYSILRRAFYEYFTLKISKHRLGALNYVTSIPNAYFCFPSPNQPNILDMFGVWINRRAILCNTVDHSVIRYRRGISTDQWVYSHQKGKLNDIWTGAWSGS